MNLKRIKRAIISVSDKSNLKLILPTLKKFNIEIISSGGSFKKIKSMKYNCIDISNYTGFSEMLDGRLKTLHPKIHAGILNIRKNKKHKNELKKKFLEAYQGASLSMKQGVSRFPAILFNNGQSVIYGVTHLPTAVDIYNKWNKKRIKK